MSSSKGAPSYEETLKHHKLTSEDLEVKCPEEFLRHVATWTNYEEWRKTDLGVDKATVEAIKTQNTDDEGKRRDLLERWRQILGHNATYSRLVHCFIDSRRADLADKVCEEFVNRKPKKCEAADTSGGTPAADDGPGDIQTFPSPAQATADDATSVGRDIPPSHNVDMIGSDQRPPPQSPTAPRGLVSSCVLSNGEQEQNPGKESSSLVANAPAGASDPPPSLMSSLLDKLTAILGQSSATVVKIQRQSAINEAKTEELKGREIAVKGYLSDKEERIKQMTEGAKQIEAELQEEKDKKEKAQEALTKKQQTIDELEDHIHQKDRELQQEKDKNETHKQLKKQLKQTKAELEAERQVKKESEMKLSTARKRMEHLQEDVDKAKKDVEVTKQEKHKVKTVLKWVQADMAEEQKRQKKITKCTYSFFLFVIVILVAILVKIVPQYCMN